MSYHPHQHHRSDLVRIATQAMIDRGLAPEFSHHALGQLADITGPADDDSPDILDLTGLLWCSIDNDDSMDLDQLTVCESLAHGALRIQVAIADVDALVSLGSPIDTHARLNTTTVYTSARIFPMLPERLSTNLTSLNPHQNRLALVTDMTFDADGVLTQSTLYRALVRNQAKLAYDAVSAWIDGGGELPPAAAAVPGMAVQLELQDAMAQRLRTLRHAQGSLEFESSQPRAVFEGSRVVDLQQQVQNRARQLIEEFMIATNGCTARYLSRHGRASLRRVVRSPERWQRIVTVAHDRGHTLPAEPDAKALSVFLAAQHRKDPVHFQDLSLIIVKLLGSGEYMVESPKMEPVGHFGLAVRDYTHSTAPNRRYPDLITARLLKATLKGEQSPYSKAELAMLAQHCTVQEDAAQKVERQMRKSDAAMVLESRIGQRFEALVTGSTPSGVWVRIFSPPAEGKLVDGQEHLNVGDALRVKLVGTNVERGFIDFVRVD
jgi:exoribonuclease-2